MDVIDSLMLGWVVHAAHQFYLVSVIDESFVSVVELKLFLKF